MAPKKINPPIEHDGDDNQLATDNQKMAELSALIIKEYGHNVPYDRSHYINKARGHIMRSAEEALELGRCLIVLKEHEAHGEWLGVLDELSLEARLAQRTMQAAVKFSGNDKSSQHLIGAAKSKSKLFELMVLDDDELAQLGDGGTVAGITLDDVERLSVSELRKALRESREEHEAKDRILADKNKKIDEQAKKISIVKKQPPDEKVKQLRTEISAIQSGIEEEIRTNLHNALDMLDADDHHEFILSQITMLEEALKFVRGNVIGDVEWEEA